MNDRPQLWVDRIDVSGSDVAAEDRRQLAHLREELGATTEMIDGSRRCIAETLEAIAKIDRIVEKARVD